MDSLTVRTVRQRPRPGHRCESGQNDLLVRPNPILEFRRRVRLPHGEVSHPHLMHTTHFSQAPPSSTQGHGCMFGGSYDDDS